MQKILMHITFIGLILGLYSGEAHAHKIDLYLLASEDFKGEIDQIKGVALSLDPLLKKSKQNHVEVKEVTLSSKTEGKALQQTLTDFIHILEVNHANNPEHYGIIITSGSYGIQALKTAKQKMAQAWQRNIIAAHIAHQPSAEHKELVGLVDIIGLPVYALRGEKANNSEATFSKQDLSSATTRVIETVGVAHTFTPEKLRKEYHKFKGDIPEANKYVAIILGGDAQTTAPGGWLYYRPEEAMKMAAYMANLINSSNDKPYFLILNGPRTGKHNPQNGLEDKAVHRNGNSDPVTHAFIEAIEREGLKKGKNFTLFDFQYGNPSLFQAVLGLLLEKKALIYPAADSSSMLTQILDCLPNGLTTAYLHPAMSEYNSAQCTYENQTTGRLNLLDKALQIVPAVERGGQPIASAREVLAQAIYRRLQEKIKG